MSKKKFHKYLKKKCPECDGLLQIVEYSKEDKGVIYTENYIECLDCGYCEELGDRHRRDKEKEDW
jgi:Zn ribbon nucleic-acid-binding protein